ncbi:bacterio-opsin activator [Halobacteriales archaeon QS_8_69_26]|nr:MAG: bacterio-opsin activator [Halobacteriales archaeon QS_8_69_26]
MKYLDVTLDLPPALRHPMEEFLRGSEAIDREELLAWNTSAEAVEYALFYVEGDLAAYRDRIDRVDSVRDVTLTRIDAGSFYSYVCQETREEEEAWRRAFARRNLVVVPPLEYDERGVRITVVGAGADLQALLADLPPEVDVTVEEIGDYDRRHATVAGGLTDRQLEAVAAAVDVGYYAVPRGGSLADVADRLDCAESTASNHLRKAESRVMRRIARATPAAGPSVAREAPRRT